MSNSSFQPEQATLADDRRLRTASAGIDLSNVSLIELAGADRRDWLQGQATQDVRLLEPGGTLAFCLCEPTGSLLAVITAWALEDRILLATDRDRAEAVLSRIEHMTIMEDVVARDLTAQYRGFSLQGPTASEDLAAALPVLSADAQATSIEGVADSVLVLRSARSVAGGWDIWIPVKAELPSRFAAPWVPAVAYEVAETARIEAGIPRWGVDMGTKTLPPELGAGFERRHVSYNKGCYTGQEILMRLHSRGHTNRTWCGLVSSRALSPGAAVLYEEKEVGKITSAAPLSLRGFIAAAMLRNEAATEGTKVRIGDVEAEVRAMPMVSGIENSAE